MEEKGDDVPAFGQEAFLNYCPLTLSLLCCPLLCWCHAPLSGSAGEGPTRKGALLHLVLTKKQGLVEDVEAGGRLGCSDHEMVEFRILRGGSRVTSRIKTLDLRRANFGLLKELLGGIPWARALKGRGVQECWSLFKCHFLHAQERCVPLRKEIQQRRQETSMVEQGGSSRAQVEEKGPWNVERGTGH